MKSSKADVVARVHKIPDVVFEDAEGQKLTSFGGLVIYQSLFERLDLKTKLRRCFAHKKVAPIYGLHRILLVMMLNAILGYRRLRDTDYYRDDPMVLRVLGLHHFPDVATISRTLAAADAKDVVNVRQMAQDMVLVRLGQERLARATLDFDGSVLTTMKHAEGTAIGFNKKKKGARSYYPLFCTFAQTGQFLDMHHRAGNVHDSNGAPEFAKACIDKARSVLPGAVIEARFDSAFFSEEMLGGLADNKVEFTASVPFERFPALKKIIEERGRWRLIDDMWSYFETSWKPRSWDRRFRFIIIRQVVKEQVKGPLQLHLFEPRSYKFDYKVIVTNKKAKAKKILAFHNGRGAQEKIFAEAKSQAQLEYVPVRRLYGNQLYCLAAMLAHNLTRELQMQSGEREFGTSEKRRPLWTFESLSTIRQRLVQRAARLIRPQGRLTLVMGARGRVREEIERHLKLA